MKTTLILIILCHFLISAASFAKENNNIEKIQVTGSRVKRINIEGPSPLLILDQEYLENSGYNSVADVLRDTNIAPFGLSRESSGSSQAGESFTDIHSASALILINGQKVVTDPNAELVDLHLIPIYAVERIEIIKDGSSAIYGSNALGGVINFIMKKNFSGQEFYARISPSLWPLYKGGSRIEGAVVWGNTYPKGSITGALQLRHNDSIRSSDRKWSLNRISSTGPHPVFNHEKSYHISDSCPSENKKATSCEFNYAKYIDTLPLISQLSGYIQGEYKWNGINLYSQLLSSYKRTYYEYPPIPGSVDLQAGHKLSIQTGSPGTLVKRFMEAGNRKTAIDYLTIDTVFGAKGYLFSTWNWNVSAKISGTSKNSTNEGLLIKDTLIKLVYDGIYDPFTEDKRDLTKALYEAKNNNSSLLLLTDAIFSGNIGPVDLAFGTQAYYTMYKEVSDPEIKNGNILSNVGSDGIGSRKIFSAFGELVYLPLDNFEIQFASRGDYYSDFGFTMNPKGAFKYQPTDSFLLRGSLGTSFIAPSLHSLYGTSSEGYPTLIDSVACFNELKNNGDISNLDEKLVKDFITDQKETIEKKDLDQKSITALTNLSTIIQDKKYCVPRQFYVKNGKNTELKETKGLSASIGSVIQINTDTSISFDGWYIKTKGSPSNGINNDTIKVELQKGSEFVAQKGITITRDTNDPHNPILSRETNGLPGMSSKLLNISSSQLAGLDFSFFSLLSNFDYYDGKFYFQNDGSVALYSKSEAFPERGFKDNIGKSGLPRWRNVFTLGWRNKKHNLTLKINSFASVTKVSNELESLPIYNRLDLSYQQSINSKTIINAGWINALLTTPPIDNTINTDSQIDESLHEVRGSYFYIGIKKLI